MIETAEDVLEETLSDEDVRAFTAFYETDFGRMVRNDELAAGQSEPGFRARALAKAKDLETDPDRRGILREIDQAILSTETAVSANVAFMRILTVAIIQAQGRDPSEFLGLINADIEKRKPGIRRSIAQSQLGAFGLFYQNLDEDELRRLLAFVKSDAGQAVYSGVLAAVHQFFETAGERIGTDFGAYLAQKKI